jgi:ribonuclease P protein component
MDAARLRRTQDIARVRAEGRNIRGDGAFSVRARAADAADGAVVRIAVHAARDLTGSVHRNRARRRVREALRVALRERDPKRGADLLVAARKAALTAPASSLRESAARALDEALGR